MAKKRRDPTRRPTGKAPKSPKPILAWGGFVDGRLFGWLSGFYDVEHLSLFKSKKDAQRCHEDVRRVRIEVV